MGCGAADRAVPGGREAATNRGHELLPHTADAGLSAHAPDLGALFEEAAAALAELAADVPAGMPLVEQACAALTGDDLPGLAFGWLNELIGLAAVEGAALAGGRITRLEERDGAWSLEGAARLASFGPGAARFRRDVKAVTFHRLAVEDGPGGWTLTAYADL